MPTAKQMEAARKKLFNDAMRGSWDRVVGTYSERDFPQDVKIARTGDTVLHLAVATGDTAIVRRLLEVVHDGAAPRIIGLRNGRHDTPLHVAAALGTEDICRLIGGYRPEMILRARNREGETPLLVAALHGRVRAFLALHRMSRGVASVLNDRSLAYCKRLDGDTILHCAVSGEHFELAFQIIYLYEGLVNVQNKKGETALHLLANKPHAFKSGSHLELFDRIIYACVVIHPLGVNLIDERDTDGSSQRKVGASNSNLLGDHTDILAISKRILTRIVGGSGKKENGQASIRRSSKEQTQSHDSLIDQLQSSREMTADRYSNNLTEIITEGRSGEQEEMSFSGRGDEQEEMSLPSDFYEQHQDHDGGDEESDNSLKEIVTGVDREDMEQNKAESHEVRRPHDQYDYTSRRAQILENVATWSIFLIYGLKILLVILGVVGIGIWRMHIIRDKKQKHKYAFQIMEELVERSTLWEYEAVKIPYDQYRRRGDTPILIAAKKGVKEVVKKILDTFPIAIQDMDSEEKNVVLLAVENRQPDVYKLMMKRKTMRDSVFGLADRKGNSALHLAATLGGNLRPWAVPGAALQMQWEIKWYKFIQRSTDHHIFMSFNREGQTARDIFSDKHKDLIKEGSKWLTNTSQSCSVVAALIAAVAFASISTVPGGTNQSSGVPLLEHQVAFEVFAISSLVALCSSVTSLVMFLSILTSRYEEMDFERDLPRKLIFGLTFVFMAIAAMLVAFCSAHFFVVQKKLRYVAFPIYAVSGLPITLFAMAHFRLYIDLIKATITHVPQRAYKMHSL